MSDTMQEEDGRAGAADQALVSDQAAARLDPSGFDPSREMFFCRKEVAGTLAMWAVRQSPYVVPDNLEAAVASMYDALPGGPGEWFFATEPQLREAVEFICLNDQTIASWNVPKSGHTSEIVFSSRYDQPSPDDDFIDLHALANNICRSLLADQAEYLARDSDGSGEADETHSGSAEGDSAGPKDIAQPKSPPQTHEDIPHV